MNRIADNADKLLAMAAVVVAPLGVLAVVLWLSPKSYYYMLNPMMLLVGAVIYLLIRKRLTPLNAAFPSEPRITPSAYLALNIAFFGLFSSTLLSVILRPETYSRPLGYFIATTLATAVAAVEILFLPRAKRAVVLSLAKSMLILVSLVYSIQAITPGLVGIDSWWHADITQGLLETGHTDPTSVYRGLPALHMLIGSTSLLTGLDFKLSTLLSLTLLQAVSLVFVYLLGRLIFNNDRLGLLAALLAGTASTYVVTGFWIRPIGLGTMLIPIITYLVLKGTRERSAPIMALALLVSTTVVLTHALSATIMAIILLLLSVLSVLYDKGYGRSAAPVAFTFVILFVTMMYGWWFYVSGHDRTLIDILLWGFEKPTRLSVGMVPPDLPHYATESALNVMGFSSFVGLSFAGVFYMVSKRLGNKLSFTAAGIVLILVGLVFASVIGGRTAVYPGRWYPTMQVLAAIPLAVAILQFSGAFKDSRAKASVLAAIVVVLSFFMSTSPHVNMDRPLYSEHTMARYFYTEAEFASASTISDVYSGQLKADTLYGGRFDNPGFGAMKGELSIELLSGDYEGLVNVLFVVREEVISKPFYSSQLVEGVVNLDYDPRETVTKLNYPHVYTSGRAFAFLRQVDEYVLLSPTTADIGDVITIKGYSFRANDMASIYFTDEPVERYDEIGNEITDYYLVRETTPTNAEGGFAHTSFRIPSNLTGGEPVRPGTYYVFATSYGSSQVRAVATLTVSGAAEASDGGQ